MKHRRLSPEAARELQARWLRTVWRGRSLYLLTRVPLFFLVLLVAGAGCIVALDGSFARLLSRPLVLLGLLAWLALISYVLPVWQFRLIQSAVAPRRKDTPA